MFAKEAQRVVANSRIETNSRWVKKKLDFKKSSTSGGELRKSTQSVVKRVEETVVEQKFRKARRIFKFSSIMTVEKVECDVKVMATLRMIKGRQVTLDYFSNS